MRSIILSLATIVICLTVSAQRDSSRIDLGWTSLDKNLTQTITVKGSDLEKMPFVSLSDAIGAWFYGAYTNRATLAYVVDGNPVTDVNIYSIYDIEEVTLVQNAAGAAAYGGTQQELVVVTTKRGKEKRGFRAAAQAGLVNANGNGTNTFTNLYHQYYLGGYGHSDKVSYGVSADWVRDVMPAPSDANDHVSTPMNLQRLRLNGYLNWQPVKGHTIGLGIGYAPERIDGDIDSTLGQSFYHSTERLRGHLVIPQLNWKGDLLPGLRQELQVLYLNSSSDLSYLNTDSTGFPPNVLHGGALSEARVSQLLVRERLTYSVTAGNWNFRPGIGFSYGHIDEKSTYATSTIVLSGNGGPVFLPPVLGQLQEMKGDRIFLSPTVDLGWRKAFDLQVGAQLNLKQGQDAVSRTVYPFATVGVDVLHFGHAEGGSSLKLFGSYAQRAMVYLNDYSLYSLTAGGPAYDLSDVNRPKALPESYTTLTGLSNNPIVTTTTQVIPVQYPSTYWTWQTGISFALPGDKLRVSYSFERRNFSTAGTVAYISPDIRYSSVFVPEWRSNLHHIDVRFKVADGKKVQWETGLGATALRSKEYNYIPNAFLLTTVSSYNVQYPQGEMSSQHLSWTGGWVNRLRVGDFDAGLDILYHFGEPQFSYNYLGVLNTGSKLNSVMTPNVYVGYRWKLRQAKTLALFLESRGLARSKTSDLLDSRRYYTLGGSLEL